MGNPLDGKGLTISSFKYEKQEDGISFGFLSLGVFDEKLKIDVTILISNFKIKISFSFTSQAHSSIPRILACGLAARTNLYLRVTMGNVAW